MKTNKLLVIIALGLAAVACSSNAQTADAQSAADADVAKKVEAKDLLPSKALTDTVSYLLGINFGSFVKQYDFGEINFTQLVKGMKEFLKAEGNQNDPAFVEQFRINPDLMNEIFNEYLGNRAKYKELVNTEKEEAFFKENIKKEGMLETVTGLQYRIADPGNDKKPALSDTVWVHYKGSLLDGTVFDECPADQDPINFPLNRVIRGWSEGMQLVGEGGKIELYIPSSLGYGAQGAGMIEPFSTLVFEVELVKVAKAAVAEE